MKYVVFDEAEVEEPGEGWKRAGLMNSEGISVDWFQKPPSHVSERHSHKSEQVFVILNGEFILHTEDESVQLSQNDTAWVDAWEEHYSENQEKNPVPDLIFSRLAGSSLTGNDDPPECASLKATATLVNALFC